ncbi:hypothetical protein FQN49_007585 [Arthroderma sp. PD_2]|nr:hypothetical protein FQN49_007585 [Arthroderma sp. PD_2]
MVSLLNLSNDLLLLIFKGLGDLDDVVHLGRSCRHLHNLLDYGRHRLDIFRAVIIHAEHHKFDLPLCYFLEANQEYLSKYSERSPPPNNCRPRFADFSRFRDGTTETLALTDEFVWWIACRWQGLRVLQDLYLHPSTRALFIHSVFPSCDSCPSSQLCNLLAAEGRLPQPNIGPDTKKLAPFSFRQTQRFYKALTAIWLAVETLVFTEVSTYRTSFAYVIIWEYDCKRTLSESFDILEAYDFVWGFLGRKIFADVQDYQSWTGNSNVEICGGSKIRTWDFFVRFTLQYFGPPNIIELLLLGEWNGSWPSNRPYYLQQLGHTDYYLDALIEDAENPGDPCFSITDLEVEIRQKFRELSIDSQADLANTFSEYRRKWWTKDARGKVFTWEEQDMWIVDRVVEAGP